MAELIPASFSDLVSRLYAEPKAQDALFGLPRRKWHLPAGDEPDLSVRFHRQIAGNPSGPAAGPHTQMAQNLLLSYIAGGRILELKTVQVNDRLKIGRPCIDMANVGYNIEWSQELLVDQSAQEYVAAAMLIEIIRRDPTFAGESLRGKSGEVIFDISVGYDLAGIRSDKVQRFLDCMRDAGEIIARLRAEIPSHLSRARELPYSKTISTSVTLSTFHGCPADEIERICEFLLAERGLDVIVKMNPPMLGKDRLEHLLYDVLGYTELKVTPTAYTSGLQYDEAVELVARLTRFAESRGRRFGCKFSNTLEVTNHRAVFTPNNTSQYLSGQPLHVITMALTDEFRRSVGPNVPISFSAGIDRQNFPQSVACGFAPVSVCTDLLRPGGYGRLPNYLRALSEAMRAVKAKTLDDYILDAFGQRAEAESRAKADGVSAVLHAGLLNTSIAAGKARDDVRYRGPHNRKAPVRIDSFLATFDCITCEKCIPVCPNAANFLYPTPQVAFDCTDVIVEPTGAFRPIAGRRFEIKREMQIASYADFCNECGNCDTFCPEYGGPYIQKPAFYGSLESWEAAAPRDGFVIERDGAGRIGIRGRVKGVNVALTTTSDGKLNEYNDGAVTLILSSDGHRIISARPIAPLQAAHRVDLWLYHTLRHLLAGVLDMKSVNPINVRLASLPV